MYAIYSAGKLDLLFAEMMAMGIASGSAYVYELSYISLLLKIDIFTGFVILSTVVYESKY